MLTSGVHAALIVAPGVCIDKEAEGEMKKEKPNAALNSLMNRTSSGIVPSVALVAR